MTLLWSLNTDGNGHWSLSTGVHLENDLTFYDDSTMKKQVIHVTFVIVFFFGTKQVHRSNVSIKVIYKRLEPVSMQMSQIN